MTLLLDKLDQDYRKFDMGNLPYKFSDRILNPILHIEIISGKYVASLGTNITRNGDSNFVACPSNSHNWIIDRNRIKPLPFDVPSLVSNVLKNSNHMELRYPMVLSLVRYGIEGIEIFVDPKVFEKANNRALSLPVQRDIPGLKAKLYPYQEHGVAWMCDSLESIGGVILADEMGLGKTIQIIAIFLLKKPTNQNPALIVCPTTLIANWCREIERFAPSLSFITHRGADRTGFYKDLMRSQIVITTYETLVNDISLFRGVDWKYLVCDEAQAAKNPESRRRKALERLSRKYTIPVTGTPMENTLMDLWSLGDLAIPGMLGEKDCFSTYYPDTEEGAMELNAITDTIILKRQVKQVASDLPERTDIDFPIELDQTAIEEYEQIKEDAILKYGPAGRLVAVGQLAIYCAHPWLRIKDVNDPCWEDKIELQKDSRSPLITPKMVVCLRLIKEAFLNGNKVIIFATYNHCGELIQRAAKQEGISLSYWNAINGSTPQEERQTIVDDYSSHEGAAALVLNPKAAGAGLNITAATVVIHYTQNWNPALEMQASARAHRRGQTQPVTIYRLFYQDTIEEVMIERSQWKRSLSDIAVPIKSRDNQDLDKALSITPSMD